MSTLNAGQGRCLAKAGLLVKPVRAAIELGAAQDVMVRTLSAVHHANRHGAADDFVAVALPTMRMGRNCMLPGLETYILGSEVALEALLRLEGMQALRRRGMIEDTEIGPIFADPGMTGAAYVRDRSCERRTPGRIHRDQARDARQGRPLGKPVKARGHDLSALTLRYGSQVLHIREHVGEITEKPIFVSTFGFSAASAPSILPVLPESARGVVDAA